MWKHIELEGYEVYQVSDTGKVKGPKGTILKSCKYNVGKHVRETVTLTSYPDRTTQSVARLVALTFIPNPFRKKLVMHIDGDRFNNNVANLRWATYSEVNRARTKKR